MKKNKAKQMLLSLGLMATVASPLVTVISCGESDETAPEITVDQKTTLDGETVQGSGTEYTLSLTQGTTITQEEIKGLFTVEDEMDEDVTLTYTWETGPFEAATTGECVLIISSEDAAGNSVAYTLTITVSPPEASDGGTVDTTTPVISVDTTSIAIVGSGTNYTLDLETDTSLTAQNVEDAVSATDDGTDITSSVVFTWEDGTGNVVDQATVDFTLAGTYVLKANVSDGTNDADEVTITIIVSQSEPESAASGTVSTSGQASGSESAIKEEDAKAEKDLFTSNVINNLKNGKAIEIDLADYPILVRTFEVAFGATLNQTLASEITGELIINTLVKYVEAGWENILKNANLNLVPDDQAGTLKITTTPVSGVGIDVTISGFKIEV